MQGERDLLTLQVTFRRAMEVGTRSKRSLTQTLKGKLRSGRYLGRTRVFRMPGAGHGAGTSVDGLSESLRYEKQNPSSGTKRETLP